MKNKNNLFKNIFFVLFAFCFMGVGVISLNAQNDTLVANAEDTASTEVTNSVPDFFIANEYLKTETYIQDEDEEYDDALIDSNVFMYSPEGTSSNYLKLSFDRDNGNVDATDDRYRWVYYPDPDNTSLFYFYTIDTVSLSINGVDQKITDGNFKQTNGLTFTNYTGSQLDGFEMIFSDTPTSDANRKTNEISILDDHGNLKEGLYTISVTYILHACTDGGVSGDEEQFSDINSANPTISYSFYCVNKDTYFENNRPNIERQSFDKEVSVSNLTNPAYAYYLYSNYSSDNDNQARANEISYIDFDYTRYELSISKDYQSETLTQTLAYDKDTSSIASIGANITSTKVFADTNTCRVYFTDVGDYNLSLSAIAIVDFAVDAKNNIYETRKYSLTGISGVTKQIMVYVYGYQAKYTDYDSPADENNNKPKAELKAHDFDLGKVVETADITSGFLNNDSNYSQAYFNTTFLISNITSYIENSGIVPIKTNQTPIEFNGNATLISDLSYVYSTTKVSSAYNATSFTLNGDTLYRSSFTGKAESVNAKYIYVIAYTYKNYFETEATLAADQKFYQVFYFEINKVLPTIRAYTETTDAAGSITQTTVAVDSFTNQDVVLDISSITNEEFNKNVTVQIYAWDYDNKIYMADFGGENGVSFDTLWNLDAYKVYGADDQQDKNKIKLTAGAKYTIRLFFSSDVSAENLSINSQTNDYFRQQTFTIDKIGISNIQGRNVTEITNSTNYRIVSNMEEFSTNQSMILSWSEKNSLAKTYAYYRYFPIVQQQYYSANTDATTRELMVSQLLQTLLLRKSHAYLPVNYTLNLDTTDNIWLPYAGNTLDFNSQVATDYVFTDAGLYLVDIYDEAGNHSVEVFMIDNTAPLFAINDGNGFKLTSTSMFITNNSTLYWAEYKGLYIENMPQDATFVNKTPANVTEEDLTISGFFTTYQNKISVDIYQKLYNNLFSKQYMQYIDVGITTDGANINLPSYNGYYITIPINSISYFTDLEHPTYTQNPADTYQTTIKTTDDNGNPIEQTYTLLIRDMSNTQMVVGSNDKTDFKHYTNHYSAKQTIIVSTDDSEFFIKYKDSTGTLLPITSNYSTLADTTAENGTTQTAKTTYLAPVNYNKPFVLSFIPTVEDNNGSTIQVDKVEINYYPYVEKAYTAENGITYHYYTIDESNKTPIVVYQYGENGNEASEDVVEEEIRLNADNITVAGKYIITRTYKLDEQHSFNPKDFYQRTYEFYVDRNGVVTNAELVTDSDGANTTSHLESLVGGDIFVAMYDNKTKADLVVTFPDSPLGNASGSSIFNNGTVRSVLTTNMLPVRIYVPEYKYTTYSQKVLEDAAITDGKYDYEVNFDTSDDENINYYYDDENGNLKIAEYLIYAEIYKDGSLIAQSSRNQSQIASTNGFLTFFDFATGRKIEYLTESGTYEVTIYQGYFGIERDFEQSLTFSFEIQRSNPDFYAQSLQGSALEEHELNGKSIYYTNQSNINLIWEAGDDYIAEIDLDSINFKAYDAAGRLVSNITTETDADKSSAYVEAPTISNGLYIAQISMEKFKIYQNGGSLEITMQYRNHDDKFYTKATKTIYVDLEAPSTNVQSLVEKSIASNMILPLSNNALRTYYTAKMAKTTDLRNTSYNISSTAEPFAYYSYAVTADYLNVLKQTLGGEASAIYVRSFGKDKHSASIQETSPSDFSPTSSSFTSIENATFVGNNYYEIVEMDRAGNLSIYSIFIIDYNERVAAGTLDQNELIRYIDAKGADYAYEISDYIAANNYPNGTHNIYAKTGFRLEDINFFGDEWAQIQLTTYTANGRASTKTLMLTPWDKENAYAFSLTTYTKIAISDLIDGLTSTRYKNNLKIYNRQTGTFENFYINIRNTTLSANLTSSTTEEYIRFALPTDADIQNPLHASTYLTRITISAGQTVLCDVENKLGYGSEWQRKFENNADIIVTITDGLGITFAINPALGFADNTRITYEFTDNYGYTAKEIHLYKETIITQEVQSNEDLYSYYDTTNGQLYYITKNGLKFLYNPNKYSVNVFDFDTATNTALDHLNNATSSISTSGGISTLLINTTNISNQYDAGFVPYHDTFVIQVREFKDDGSTGDIVKNVYFKLYNQLPTANHDLSTLGYGQFRILDTNGANITNNIISETLGEEGYYSEIRIQYRDLESTFVPIKYSISTDGHTWTEITSGTFLRCETEEMQKYYLKVWYQEDYLQNELGTSRYVFGYVPSTQIYEFNLSSLTSTFWIEKTIGGVTEIVEKSNSIYKTATGQQYSNHYIVNLSYADRSAIKIKTNKEQEIVIEDKNGIVDRPWETITDSALVTSEIYHLTNKHSVASNVPPFDVYFVISYVPSSDTFVDEFYTYNLNGGLNTSENLVGFTSKNLVVSENNSSLNSIELQWTKYYGIEQNEIQISIVKDGMEMTPTVYTRKTANGKLYNYIYLKYSGKYLIKLHDMAGNVQKFNKGSTGQTEQFTLIFLKDVPFTVTYKDAETGEEKTTLPIKEAVYNGEVTLKIDKNTRSEFYSLSGYPIISVKRNGVEYTREFHDDTNYIFNESGYYEVSFTATSNDSTIGKIRQETYQFTIQNPNEHRYNYIYNKYSNYYVEKVVKDGEDITEDLLSTLSLQTIKANGKSCETNAATSRQWFS